MSKANRLAAANRARSARHLVRTAINAGAGRRGNSPKVRRHSQYAGDYERRQWRQHNLFSARERRARLEVVRTWNYAEKKAGACWGPLGPSGERFLDSMMGLRCFRTGRLDLSIKSIAEKLRMCVQTVCSYIARLEEIGLLMKLRRSAPIENPEPGGPLVEQLTNAYWFLMPAELAERVRQILGRGGKPADAAQHELEQAAALEAMLATLSAEELARFRAGDTAIFAEALARLGRAVDRRARFQHVETNPVEKIR